VAYRVVQGGSQWGGMAWARGGSWVWVAGWLSLSLDQSLPQPSFFRFFFFFFFLDLPDLLDF
jgi:hypothetical protein